MAAQGSGGAFEISQRMTAMVGWGATTDFREDWTWWVGWAWLCMGGGLSVEQSKRHGVLSWQVLGMTALA